MCWYCYRVRHHLVVYHFDWMVGRQKCCYVVCRLNRRHRHHCASFHSMCDLCQCHANRRDRRCCVGHPTWFCPSLGHCDHDRCDPDCLNSRFAYEPSFPQHSVFGHRESFLDSTKAVHRNGKGMVKMPCRTVNEKEMYMNAEWRLPCSVDNFELIPGRRRWWSRSSVALSCQGFLDQALNVFSGQRRCRIDQTLLSVPPRSHGVVRCPRTTGGCR